MAILYSVLALSNATKNQRDVFSSFMQSYSSKVYNCVFYAILARYVPETMGMTGKYLIATYAAILAIDALTGFFILYKIFSSNDDGIKEQFIQSEMATKKEFNDRVPVALKNTVLKEKLFNQGWK